MKVSIIIPVYHVEKYIERCVRSVLSQDYRPLEVILIDDCSGDNSMAIAKSVIEENDSDNDIEFKFLKHETNQKLGETRNTGIRAATGDYVYFLDSDDEISPDCITSLAKEIEKRPDTEIVIGDMTGWSNNLERYKSTPYIDDNVTIRKMMFTTHEPLPHTACNKLISRKFIIDNDLFFMKGILFEDTHWLYRLTMVLQRMAFVFKQTYIRYINEGSIMTSMTTEKELVNNRIIIDDRLEHIEKPCYDNQLFTYLYAFLPLYAVSKGNYGYKKTYSKFINLFLHRGHFKMAAAMIAYRWKIPLLPEDKVKARLRGIMYNEMTKY